MSISRLEELLATSVHMTAVMIFLGALFFWFMSRRYEQQRDTTGWTLWVDTQEPICAGLIAGAALIGIGDVLIRVFVFGG